MPDLAEKYVRLAHALDAHTPGYIDGYFGPAEWAVKEARPVKALRGEVQNLAEAVHSERHEPRRRFLEAQVRAMHTSVRLLAGEEVPYEEEVRGLYDIAPERTDDAQLDAALGQLNDLLPGEGDLLARELPLRARVQVDLKKLPELMDLILAELRARTEKAFGLPRGERFETRLVQREPWGGYNWPLGQLRSRIDINTDLPIYLHNLPGLLAHEGYPGHHTEHAWKEALLAEGEGRREHTLLLINAPECVVSEGVATVALSQIMTRSEVRDWLTGELANLAGADPEALDVLLRAGEAKEALGAVSGNAALMLHGEGRGEAEVQAYLEHYGLRTPEQARKNLEFIRHPNFRSYIFTYTAGEALLGPLLGGENRAQVFRRLLTESVTPGELRAWAER